MARLQDYYRKDVVPDLMKKFGYKTSMEVPRIKKITLNMGVGETTTDKKILDNAVADLTKIAGQKPVVTKAKKSIATFKVRKGYPVGCMVTLRGQRMYEFLDRLVTVAIPRIRDFRGISSRAFDGRENGRRGARAARRLSLSIQDLKDHHGQTRPDQPRPKAPQDGGQVRRPTRGAARNHQRRPTLRRRAPGSAREATAAAQERLARAPAQPLQADRPAARSVSQVRAGAQQAARNRAARRDSWPHQGELVGGP